MGKGLKQRDLLVRERTDLHPTYQNSSDRSAFAQQRRRKRGSMTIAFRVLAAYRILVVFCREVTHMDRPTITYGSPTYSVPICKIPLAGMTRCRNSSV